ncbi:hypothetical protein KKB44_01975 [Candidatus Micrarchaeota archaeon]|nr:hypothetical protein [Candidatus Micrarchaeota archaeon]
MELDLDDVAYSEYDLKRKIKIPKILDPMLAEDLGFHIGDGCMLLNVRSDNGRLRHYFNYTGNREKDNDYFQKRLIVRKMELYNLKIKIKKNSKNNSISATFHSRAIFEFFCRLGVPYGKKKDIEVPQKIKHSTLEVKSAFLRGLAAADFCVSIKNRMNGMYPTIHFGTVSKKLFEGVCKLVEEFGVPFTKFENTKIDKKRGTISTSYCLDINGRKRLKMWLDRIGFSDKRNLDAVMKIYSGPGRDRTCELLHVKQTSYHCPAY